MPRTSNKGEEILHFIHEQTAKKGYPRLYARFARR